MTVVSTINVKLPSSDDVYNLNVEVKADADNEGKSLRSYAFFDPKNPSTSLMQMEFREGSTFSRLYAIYKGKEEHCLNMARLAVEESVEYGYKGFFYINLGDGDCFADWQKLKGFNSTIKFRDLLEITPVEVCKLPSIITPEFRKQIRDAEKEILKMEEIGEKKLNRKTSPSTTSTPKPLEPFPDTQLGNESLKNQNQRNQSPEENQSWLSWVLSCGWIKNAYSWISGFFCPASSA